MRQEWKAVGSYGTVGFEIVLSILVGLFIGRWLDGKLGTAPYLTLLWVGFGMAAAIKALQRTMKEMRAETEREEREHGNPAPMYEQPDRRAQRKREQEQERMEGRDEE